MADAEYQKGDRYYCIHNGMTKRVVIENSSRSRVILRNIDTGAIQKISKERFKRFYTQVKD